MGKPEAGKYKCEFSQGTDCPGQRGDGFPFMGTCCLSSFLLARANYFWTWSHLHLDVWCLSNFNVSINHLEILLRCRLRFSSLRKSEGWGWGFKCLPFSQDGADAASPWISFFRCILWSFKMQRNLSKVTCLFTHREETRTQISWVPDPSITSSTIYFP